MKYFIMGIIAFAITAFIACILLTPNKTIGASVFDSTGKIPSFQVNEQFVHGQSITASDTVVLAPSQIYVGSTSTLVKVVTLGGDTLSFTNFPVGTILPVVVTKVLASTTATGLIALQ